MKLYIKNMVCPRCISAVKSELENLDIDFISVDLGEVELQTNDLDNETKSVLADNLQKIGFELIDDDNSKIVDKIKTIIIEYIHYDYRDIKVKFSEFLSDEMKLGYTYMSNLFAAIESTTIEQYVIKQKIERAKELLYYNELNLSEISYKLGYSSVAHLSSQFKKVTGMTPSAFKKLKDVKQRNTLDEV